MEAECKRDRSHEAKCDVIPFMQACPQEGCSSWISWEEVAESKPHTKPLRPSRAIKERFKCCNECAARVFEANRRVA